MERLLRISFEGTFGFPHEVAKKHIDFLKYSDGQYYSRYTRLNEFLEKEVIKKKLKARDVSKIFEMLSTVHVPAFPKHIMGCDGGFTELEVGNYEGKSHFRWWSCPPEGWEILDEIAQQIIHISGFKID